MDQEGFEQYEETSQMSKMKKLFIDYPALPVGMTALIAIVGHGFYNLKRKNIKLSLYLIHYRVAAQGTFVGCLTLGLAYTMFKRHIYDKMMKGENDR